MTILYDHNGNVAGPFGEGQVPTWAGWQSAEPANPPETWGRKPWRYDPDMRTVSSAAPPSAPPRVTLSAEQRAAARADIAAHEEIVVDAAGRWVGTRDSRRPSDLPTPDGGRTHPRAGRAIPSWPRDEVLVDERGDFARDEKRRAAKALEAEIQAWDAKERRRLALQEVASNPDTDADVRALAEAELGR